MEASMKTFFLFVGVLLWIGIWQTGFKASHWLLYLPATFFLFSAVTGVCPGMILFKELFKKNQNEYQD